MDTRIERLVDRTLDSARLVNAGVGALRLALLFGSVAIALALIVTPLLERRSRETAMFDARLDPVTTGSVPKRRAAFTVRRSVLQPSPEAVCIISSDGSRRGAC